jgi:hypothetical protein
LDDDAALAECVLRLLDDSALSERLTKHAREVVESRYSAARFARAVLDVVSRAHQAMPPSRLASARMSHGLIRATALAEERLLQLEARPSGVWARLSAGRRLIQRLLRAKG